MPQTHATGFRPLDPGRINTMDPIECRYWCEEMQCSESELRSAIAQVGEHSAAVRAALHPATALRPAKAP